MSNIIEPLLQQLLEQTLQLKEVVDQKEAEPDDWFGILEKRELTINKLSPFLSEMNESQRSLFTNIANVNAMILPVMLEEKQQLSKKIGELQELKAASNSYNHYYGKTAFGAFFDQRK
ncbi:hypothetical protein ABHN11_14250 [Brevibacillus centrosporus]|uniref:hypothetical protein n=1 Tax=Brevibacillus centrosporus TaxID=54910 RepID=UPI003D1F0F86